MTKVSNEIPDNILKIMQNCISLRPVIVLGSGASCQYGISGMPALAKYLIDNITPEAENQTIWDEFKNKITSGIDLETVLHQVNLPISIEKKIICLTNELISSEDKKVLEQVINKKITFPLSELLQFITRTANPSIKIITTNYDRIAEYAIDQAQLIFNNGFQGKYIKYFSGFNSIKANNLYSIDILKVHGSLDWFYDNDSNVISITDNIKTDIDYIPLIITPGLKKYENTHNEPFRTIITKSDNAFENAGSIFCIGYGFNDTHIQPKLIKRIKKGKIPIVIVTKKLSENAIKFIKEAAHDSIIGIEEHSTGTKIIASKISDDILINGSIWQLSEFIKLVM